MNKTISKILVCIMMINAIFLNVVPAFGAVSSQKQTPQTKAAPKPKEGETPTNFTWNSQATLNEKLELVKRKADSQEALFTWDVDKLNGAPIDNNTYTLKYPIADGKVIEFSIKNKSQELEIDYKVNGSDKVTNSIPLTIYKDGTYVEASKKNFPNGGGVELLSVYSGNAAKDKANAVKFKVKVNNGLCFKYQNNLIKFYYSGKDGKVYFETNNIQRGNIYPFDLSYQLNGKQTTENKKIFTGLKLGKSKPFANANKQNQNGQETIDQTTERKIFPGGDIVGVDIPFEFPKKWTPGASKVKKDNVGGYNGGKFEYTTSADGDIDTVISIGHLEENKKLQITINNIYADNGVEVVKNENTTKDIQVKYTKDDDKHKGIIRLTNLEASTMYSEVSVSAKRETKDPFETISAIYPVGTVYTYPSYRVIALGVKEFYLELQPFKGYNGFYIVYQGDIAGTGTMLRWATYEEKKTGTSKILIALPLNALTQQVKNFKVEFSFTPPDLNAITLPFTSQTLKFKPSEQDIVLATPKNFKVVSSNIVKDEKGNENLFLSLKWDIDYESVIKHLIKRKNGDNGAKSLEVTYHFSQGLTQDTINKEFAAVKLNLTDNSKKPQEKPSEDKEEPKDDIQIEYIKSENTNSIDIVPDKCRTTTRIETSATETNKIYEANVTFKIPVNERNSPSQAVLQYPNTYFIAVKGEYVPKDDKKPYTTGDSLPVTLTLDGITNIEIAAPQNLKVLNETIGKNEFAVQYDTLQYKEEGDALYSYNEIMLKTLGKEMDDSSIKYDFYITQRKDLVDKMTEAGKVDKLESGITGRITTLKFDTIGSTETPQTPEEKPNERAQDDSITSPNNSKPAVYTVDLGKDGIDALRKEKIVKIEGVPQNFETLDTGKINPKQKLTIKGLDENQTYYVVGVTRVMPIKSKNNEGTTQTTTASTTTTTTRAPEIPLSKQKELAAEPGPLAPPSPANPGDVTVTLKEEFSRFSKIVTATTVDKNQKPTENEKIPPAPLNFKAEEISLNSVNIVWDRVIENIPEEETGTEDTSQNGGQGNTNQGAQQRLATKEDSTTSTTATEPSTEETTKDASSYLEYQFIKVPKEQLSDEFLKSKDSFAKTWESLDKVKEKYGIQTNKDKILEFDEVTKTFKETDPIRYEYLSPSGKQGKIADKILSPNEIYFYYIRTVRMAKVEEGTNNQSDATDKATTTYEPVAYSVWVPLSFTTKNVTPPLNLRVEPNAKYNKENEVVISFDIPKMNHDLIGKEYDIQYSIKEDLGPWSEDRTMPVDKITIVDNEDGKTMKVTYKITGLKSGKLYTIRVKLFNKLLNVGSMYSNEVEHRTNTNNSDNDYDETVGNWNDNFKQKIEELKNQSYWFIKNDANQTIVYYRPQYFDTIADKANSSLIPLVSGVGGSYKEYYLPASSVIKAFEQGKGFKISYKTSEIILSPKFLNNETNETLKNLKIELEKKSANLQDYFVKVTTSFQDGNYVINGSDSLSPIAKIELTVVTTKTTIAEFDQQMYTYINELLATTEFSTDVKDKIGTLVKENKTNAEMVVEVEKIVDKFRTRLGDRLSKEMAVISVNTLPIKYTDSDIIFTYPVASGISSSGYKKSGSSWVSANTGDYLGKKAIFTREAGEYIFAGKKLVINGVSNLPNGPQITNLVIKYGLDDFLGKNGSINMKAPMTRDMAIGCLSRLAGATKTQNPIEFFKSKGVVISTRNQASNITQEEGVYLIMKVYEMKTGTKMDTIKIKNYNQTSGIKNINKNYKKAVQVAFQTGIYNDPNMNAKASLSTQDFLNSITKMATMLGM